MSSPDKANGFSQGRRQLLRLSLLSAFLPTPARANLGSVAEGWNNDAIEWLDFEDGQAEQKKTGKPMLVVIHTTWCPFCARYKKQFFDPRVVELAKSFVMVMMDRDLEKAETAKLGPGLNYMPRTLFFSPNGTLRPEIKGANPEFPHWLNHDAPEELVAVMKMALAK